MRSPSLIPSHTSPPIWELLPALGAPAHQPTQHRSGSSLRTKFTALVKFWPLLWQQWGSLRSKHNHLPFKPYSSLVLHKSCTDLQCLGAGGCGEYSSWSGRAVLRSSIPQTKNVSPTDLITRSLCRSYRGIIWVLSWLLEKMIILLLLQSYKK